MSNKSSGGNEQVSDWIKRKIIAGGEESIEKEVFGFEEALVSIVAKLILHVLEKNNEHFLTENKELKLENKSLKEELKKMKK